MVGYPKLGQTTMRSFYAWPEIEIVYTFLQIFWLNNRNVREHRIGNQKCRGGVNPEKMVKQGTQDEEKQRKTEHNMC